jgi:adenosylcobinamide kinase/adenosylcobinamide-phosphate guanylyltransferase
MIQLITGGSGSGKSAYAEQWILTHFHTLPKYYLATMKITDEESQKKVKRHQDMRSTKGFVTIEQPVQIELAAVRMKEDNACVLLECLSNLIANEMFGADKIREEQFVFEKVTAGITTLLTRVKHLVIVTNNVFEDGIRYEESTLSYLRALARCNEWLARQADGVIEVVAGIPVIGKGELS